MSGGYSSKLDESIALRICGMMGGVSVRLRRPSQLNPSNHLWQNVIEGNEKIEMYHYKNVKVCPSTSNKSIKILVFLDVADFAFLVAQSFGRIIAVWKHKEANSISSRGRKFRCTWMWDESIEWMMIIPAELFDEGGGVPGDVARKVDGVNALENDVVRLHGVGTGEGRRARQQFEHEHAQRPVVGADVVAFVQNDFRGYVFGSAAKRPRFPSGLHKPKEIIRRSARSVKPSPIAIHSSDANRTCNFLANPKSTNFT